MEAVRPKMRGLLVMPSKYYRCGRRHRVHAILYHKAEDISTAKAPPHLHYLTVGMVSNGQVTIIKHHQADFRQKQDFPFQNVQKYVARHDQHLYDRQMHRKL